MGEALIGLLALTAMETVLGIDNIVFITIVTGRLPVDQRTRAFRLGLALAMVMRILLLLTLTWILGLTTPVFTLESLGIPSTWIIPSGLTDPEILHEWDHFWKEVNEVSWRDLILLGGGLFLVAKSVHEVHGMMEHDADDSSARGRVSFVSVLIQIMLLDIIFSLDSVITAVGMVSRDKLWVMITAVVLSIGIMVTFAARIGDFVHKHPTLKMLALSFLILIGVMLVAEGLGTHVNKGYIYFSMVFALLVEFLNMRVRHSRSPSAQNDTPELV